MVVYWSIFLWSFLLSLAFKNKKTSYIVKLKNGKYQSEKYPFWVVALALLALWFFSGYRTGGVGDTTTYFAAYEKTPTEFEFPKYTSTYLIELLRRFSKAYITTDPTGWLFILATLAMVPLCIALSEFSVDLCVSVSFFILSGCFEYFFNGARQLIAICICFYATKYLFRDKIVHYILLVIMSSFIHPSSLVMLTGIVFYKIKPWSKMAGIMCVAVAMIGLLPSSVLESIIGEVIEGTDYAVYANKLTHGGVNFFRFLTVIVPTVFSYMYRDRIEKLNNPILNYCVNMSLVASLVYFVALFMTALVAVRVAMYFLVFNMLLYPYLFKSIFPENMRSYKYVFYLAYLLFFYYQMEIIYGGLHYISAPLGIYA